MRLTDEQAAMQAGALGEVPRRAMQLLVRLGEIYAAPRMVPIASAQISGVSYKSIGAAGLAFVEDFAKRGGRVRVPSTLNPAGLDRERWSELGFDPGFAAQQARILDAYTAMGIRETATCTPYLLAEPPPAPAGGHLAWAESSAVSFANTVLGARTNREGGPSSLAAALCGCTPAHGLHLDEHRRPTLLIEVTALLESTADYGALGTWAGRLAGDQVPIFEGLDGSDRDALKALGAAMAASGAVALYHVRGVTPEASEHSGAGLPVHRFDAAALADERARLSGGGPPDAVMLGCPHASLEEIERLESQIGGRRLRRPLWICTSRDVADRARALGLCAAIERAGGQIVRDTCMVVAPIEDLPFRTIGVDSGKAACYLPSLCQKSVFFASAEQLVLEALR